MLVILSRWIHAVTNSGRTNLLSSPLLSSSVRLCPDLTGPPTGVDPDLTPPHLARPQDRSCLTVVHTNGVHFCDIWYCSCDGSEDSHLQLMMAGLFPATTKSPRTAFTFQVLDDFIRDNVECSTTAMNYYSKLQRVTSNVSSLGLLR